MDVGRPMDRHLAAAGHRVVAYDPAVHADTVPADLATAGVRVTDDPRQLGRAEVSLSMLPDAAATESLLLGEHGLLGGCGASHVHVVMGTVGPAAVRALAEKTRAAGVALVDAPVSGTSAWPRRARSRPWSGPSPPCSRRSGRSSPR
jgi:3-hydroxyisobutyrate dehydrogenase-like beta-hydroxyacid dehydrogenase